MPVASWNEAEDEALRRLPWRARVVYLQGIRRHMDYATGWAGRKRVLSYQFFFELLECSEVTTAPDPKVSKRGLQTIFLMLERVGLVEWSRGSSAQRGVIFRCILADTDKSAQKQAGPKRDPSGTQEAGPKESHNHAPYGGAAGPKRDPCCTREAGPPPESGTPEKKERNNVVDLARPNATAEPVGQVFGYWREVMHKQRAKLDEKRRRAIASRLKEGYSVAEIKTGIDGCAGSVWHQGRNDRRRPFNDIELICRSASKLDGFIAMAQQAQQADSELEAFLCDDERTFEGEFHRV